MSQLFLPDGKVYSPPVNKKAPPPATGQAFGAWAGRDIQFQTLPGGGVVQFDLSKLTVQDFRNMRDHYQVNASLSVLSFMQHQSDWDIVCEDKKIRDFCHEQIEKNWTGLNRTMGTANWAGFSPAALDWENEGRNIVLDKVKDLIPEECDVNWKKVDGWAPPGRTPPKFNSYDGIKQIGQPWPIPVENSYWYPLLMENGNYYGRHLLKAAFTPYFFSMIVHLFANRYFERFGEPTPIGRAPFDEEITLKGTTKVGAEHMLDMMMNLRNRGAVVLPNDRTVNDNGSGSNYDYELDYLESQMRGADFERYLTRLDEEISIGMYTPILLLRTADVGSYNLGQGHMQVYLWMLNAMNDDRKIYLDKYILSKMVDYNFGPNAPRAKIVFRKKGNSNAAMVQELMLEVVRSGKAKVDYEELGTIAGMSLTEIRETVKEPAAPGEEDDDAATGGDAEGTDAATRDRIAVRPVRGTGQSSATAKEVVARVRGQIENAFRSNTFGDGFVVSMGFKRRMAQSLEADGYTAPEALAGILYAAMDNWLKTVVSFGTDEFESAESFVSLFEAKFDKELQELTSGAS